LLTNPCGRSERPEQQRQTKRKPRRVHPAVLASVSDFAAAAKVRIQYGGSVKPQNAEELLRQKTSTGRWSAALA
jgi:triosephosphate isomerase